MSGILHTVGISASQLPPPADWQAFERLCYDIWREIWRDPETKFHGRSGQSQKGVDIYGRPGGKWAGVQCKGKDNYSDRAVTISELEREVALALDFSPALTHFTLATSGKRDAAVQQRAREISEENVEMGRFSVTVCSWADLRSELERQPTTLLRHYPWIESVARQADQFFWVREAQRAAEHVSDQHFPAHRGAILWRPGTTAVFGNDGYDSPASDVESDLMGLRVRAQVENVRDSLRSRNLPERSFGKSDDGYTWVILVETEKVEELMDLVWCGFPGACQFQRQIAFSRLSPGWSTPVHKNARDW
tara:strand:+ start:135 stop:1052 length:918 start_codon:yes stop_codon:yes gene_type:complete